MKSNWRGLASILWAVMVGGCAGAAHAEVPATFRDGEVPGTYHGSTYGGSYEVEVLVEGGRARGFGCGGERYVLGEVGRRYTLRVWNRSGRRIEAVVSVDGRDVVDGKPGDFRAKRGYLVPAFGFVDIDGWRLSEHQAAAFRFTSVANSYAGRMGTPRNVGVIGVAVFPELERRMIVPPVYPHHHQHRHYPGAADSRREADTESQDQRAPSAPSASTPAPSAEASGRGDAPADAMAKGQSAPRSRPGLGTAFGEAVSSQVHEVAFLRASSHTPAALLTLRYNDRRGLLALGIDVDGAHHRRRQDAWLRHNADPFPVSHRPYASPPPGWSE